MTYQFQGLLHKNKDLKISGPMGPVLGMNEWAKEMGFKYDALLRVMNPHTDTGYDHLIARWTGKEKSTYFFIIDMGGHGLPVAVYTTGEEVTITPIYKKHCEKEMIQHHRWECEMPNRTNELPYMILSEDDIELIIKEAEESGEFEVKEHGR